MDFGYSPLIKGKGFCPNPVAKFGIPKHADSLSYPHVLGTQAHEDWWYEQFYYCVHGYTTGGIYIPGRYYFYLNFEHITTVGRGNHFPDFIDLDLEYFLFIEDCKRRFKGIISLKGRRRGLSEKVAKGVFSHGYRFRPNDLKGEKYHAAIVAGLQVYSDGFFKKFKTSNLNLPPEMRVHELTNVDEECISGYLIKTNVGEQKAGSQNQIDCRTMFTNPNVLKGEYLDDCVFEEAGEFKVLQKGFSATKACFQVGTKMVGTPYVYGTGGKITSSTKEFQEMWHDHESYNLERFPVFGQRLLIGFFIGSRNENGQIEENCPNIRKMQAELNLEDEQILGCEDVQEADDNILKERKRLSQAKNKEPYFEYYLDNPRNEKDAFLKFSGNDFDPEALAEQMSRIDLLTEAQCYGKYILTWKRNDKGERVTPLAVDINPVSEEELKDPNIEENLIYIRELPLANWNNIDVAGIDSYDQDKARTSKSLGGMVGMRRRNHPNKNWQTGKSFGGKRFPIFLIRNRPKRKEIFYDNCLKAAVAYNLVRNVMIDAGKPAIAKHFKDNGGEQFLAFRPRSFESANSEQTHEYGMLLTSSIKSKSAAISLAQTYVLDELDECWFPQLINGLQEYDIEQKDSDWDEVDALMLALVRDSEMRGTAYEEDELKEDPYAVPDWRIDENGEYYDASTAKDINNSSEKGVGDLFLQKLDRGEF
jgi:hypothetical protein